MLAFGATACLSKETQARDILSAIHLASRGLHVLPKTVREFGLEEAPGPDLLTPREADVLELLQQGRSNSEIAGVLHVGKETVRTHAPSIYRKLGVQNRRELASLGSAPTASSRAGRPSGRRRPPPSASSAASASLARTQGAWRAKDASD
jgi:DNA-binding NarL/FixJ family response regulator